MAVDPKLNNAAVLAQRAYNTAVSNLAAAQKAIATITARGGTATAAQTAALTAAQNAVNTSSTTVKSAQMALNAAKNDVAVAAGTTGKAVSPAVDSGVKQQQPYNVRTTTGTGPTLSSSNGLLDIVGAAALAAVAANPLGTARLVGSLFSSAKDILGVGGTTSSTTAPPAASNIGESVFDPGPPIQESVFDPRQDVGENVFDPGETYNGPATEESVFDPRQDVGENVFDPGETYNGPATEESVFDPRQDVGENVFDPAAALPNPSLISAAPINDPYAGLTSDQIRLLGGADPTDPYIRARLGIPQLTDSPLAANASFGTVNTGVPILDTAISSLGNLFGFNNTKTGTTTGLPVPTPDTSAVAQDATKLLAGDTVLTDDEDQNLQNIVGAQGEIVRAEENIQSNNRQILANEESQAAAQEQQRQAQAIIDQNNAELADDTLPDSRRAELEANNAAQRASIAENAAVIDEAQNNIDNATTNNEQQTDSILTNQGVIGENAEAFAINNNSADPTRVSALEDPGIQENVFDPGVGPPQSESVFDPRQDVGENVFDPGATFNGPATEESVFDPRQDVGENVFDPGETQGLGPPISTTTQTLTDEETAALFDGDPNVVTPAEQSAQDAQTAADAAALYPGTDNTNLKNINEASGAIAQNEAGIANAQSIIDQNNAELADPDISDERRAELEANNASQENYIRLAEDNTAENELVIESNADAFAAGGGDPDSGQGPDAVAALEDPGLQENVFDPGVGPPQSESVFDPTQDVGESVFDPGETINADGESVFDPENVEPNSDPFEQARFEAELAADIPESEIVLTADEQAAADDPFEARRLELEQESNREQLALEATDVEPDLFTGQTDEFGGVDEAVAIEQADIDTRNDPALSEEEIQAELDRAVENEAAEDVELSPEEVDAEIERAAAEDAEQYEATDVNSESDQGLPQSDGTEGGIQDQINNQDAAAENAAKQRAQEQATLQARYKQPASSDWRVRLQLAPNADYLYKDRTGSTILAPLYDTDGVIFPYTPQIETSYNANYEMYDLTHSNFRGYFYKNSRVNDINIRATFTAQDTQEANYLLAVIHFFRSVTKMFYGAKDKLRGAPPPLTYLSGLGQYQFNQHPCVVSQFNYSLPNDVDYIRAGAPNNYGTNLLTQRARTGAIAPEAGNPSLARLFGTQTKPQQGADPTPPSPSMINQNVNNLAQATYVPTKIEISLTLLPINTRSQVSTQFNMKEFASGALIKGGFW